METLAFVVVVGNGSALLREEELSKVNLGNLVALLEMIEYFTSLAGSH